MTITASGFTVGRPAGAINIASRELKEFWHNFFTSEEYRTKAKQRILDGSAPHLESYLLNRIYGKPKEHVELSVVPAQDDLSMLSVEELARRAEGLLLQLKDAQELEAAIPAEYHVEAAQPASQPEEKSIRPLSSAPPTTGQESNPSLSMQRAAAQQQVRDLHDAAVLREVERRRAAAAAQESEAQASRSDGGTVQDASRSTVQDGEA